MSSKGVSNVDLYDSATKYIFKMIFLLLKILYVTETHRSTFLETPRDMIYANSPYHLPLVHAQYLMPLHRMLVSKLTLADFALKLGQYVTFPLQMAVEMRFVLVRLTAILAGMSA